MTCGIANLDAQFIQGDDVRLTIAAQRPDGTPINISGCLIEYQMRDPSGNIVVTKETPTIEIFDADSGVFIVPIPHAESGSLAGNYTHEAQITDGDGDITTLTNPDLSPGKVFVRKQLIQNS